jgi:hypothetical protein
MGGVWAWTGFYPQAVAGLAIYACSLVLLGTMRYRIGAVEKHGPSELVKVAFPFSLGTIVLFLPTIYYFQIVPLVLIATAPIIAGYEVAKASRIMDLSAVAALRLARNTYTMLIVMVPLLFIALWFRLWLGVWH